MHFRWVSTTHEKNHEKNGFTLDSDFRFFVELGQKIKIVNLHKISLIKTKLFRYFMHGLF